MDTTNATLLKTTCACKLEAVSNTMAAFKMPVDEGDDYRVVRVDRRLWDDIGRPETITVTIEPGDKLNS